MPADELPKCEFVEDVAAYVEGKDIDKVLSQLQDNLRVFKQKEQELFQRRVRALNKEPELQRTLDLVDELIAKRDQSEDLITDFQLADGIFVKAKVSSPQTVNLWLGANVMLEYSLDEAHKLLSENLSNLKQNLVTSTEDLAFIKDCTVTTEVCIARVYNYDVERRKKERESAGPSPS